MFEIDKGDSYEWDVEIQEPTSEGHKTETFTALFNRISQPRIDELNEKVRQRMIAARAGEPVDGMIDDMQIADEVFAGWTAGMLKNGAPVEYTPALKKKLLARSAFAAAIVRAWNDAIGYGRKKTS
jgi:hypothetical protein